MAALRVRQVKEGADFLIKGTKNEEAVTALREIAAKRIRLKKHDD
jgi:DNA-directed RNA polymerase subunit omega